MAEGERFPKSARLIKRRDFDFRGGIRIYTRYFCFQWIASERVRLGISISKKVIKVAVGRNRVRRLLREAFRREMASMGNWDCHVRGLPRLGEEWKELGLAQVEKEFRRAHCEISNKRS